MSILTLDQKLDLIEASGIVGWKLVWDGCHKIYILTRPEQQLELRPAGFDPDADVYPAAKIRELWGRSCGLRFVHLWDLTLDVPWNISQFEGQEEDDAPGRVSDQ